MHYHVTARRNADAIRSEGLRTDVGGWDTVYVWLFDDRTVAEGQAERGAWGGVRGDNVIIEVDATGLDLIPDPHPGWGRPEIDDHAFAHAGPIPANRIEVP